MLINAHISILISNFFHCCMNNSLSWSSWNTWFFSLSFCSTIVFIQLSSSISQVHLHRHVQNTVTSNCGTVYCKLCNVCFLTVFCCLNNSQYCWFIGISQFSIVHWVVSVNNEILQCVVATVLGECMCSGSVRDACNMSHISLKDWNLDLMLITK